MRMSDWIGVVMLCLFAPTVQATTTYSYFGVVQDPGNIKYGSSNTVHANLYLAELADAGSFTASSDGGLFSAGVAIINASGVITSLNPNVGNEPTGFSGVSIARMTSQGNGAYIQDYTGNSAQQGVMPISSTTYSNGTTYSLYLLGSMTMDLAPYSNPWATVESLYDAPQNDGVPGAGNYDTHTLTFGSVSPSGYDLDGKHQTVPLPPGVTAADAGDAHPGFLLVPEPASLAVFGLGAVGLLIRRKRRT